MFSGFPSCLPSDVMLESLSQTFNGEYTPWDSPEGFPSPESHESFVSNSSSNVIHSPELVASFQTSDYPEKKTTQDPVEMNRDELIMSERKQRRRISNRESAKRSRVRKQKHLEKLTSQVNRLMIEKTGLSNRLLLVLCQNQRLRNENHRFLSEYRLLREKLSELRQLGSPSVGTVNACMAVRKFNDRAKPPLSAYTTNLIR